MFIFQEEVSKMSKTSREEKPLERYSIDNLSKTEVPGGKFKIEREINKGENFISFLFRFQFNPNLDGKTLKSTTGQINIPLKPIENPQIIIMLRGYVNQKTYKTGDGTRKASEFFAKEGFITIAPDFLGYADSDRESEDIFETRFQTYTTVLSLIKTLEKTEDEFLLETNDQSLDWEKLKKSLKKGAKIMIWSHSNGGQIALTVLAVTSGKYPTVLWAPVSKFFPYSVLYFTDESDDKGKLIRKKLSEFESKYDTDLFSFDQYLERIEAPIKIDHGEKDKVVPIAWSEQLYSKIASAKKTKDLTFERYPLSDHNMLPEWQKVVESDLIFFRKHQQK